MFGFIFAHLVPAVVYGLFFVALAAGVFWALYKAVKKVAIKFLGENWWRNEIDEGVYKFTCVVVSLLILLGAGISYTHEIDMKRHKERMAVEVCEK